METLWLRDLLPVKLPNAHIMTFQYDSSTHGMSEHAARANAGKLAGLLRDVREDYVCASFLSAPFCDSDIIKEEENRPIVFVGHNLRGLSSSRWEAFCQAYSVRVANLHRHSNMQRTIA
jgi:hypothetical protein